jgi:hypothetical protein
MADGSRLVLAYLVSSWFRDMHDNPAKYNLEAVDKACPEGNARDSATQSISSRIFSAKSLLSPLALFGDDKDPADLGDS